MIAFSPPTIGPQARILTLIDGPCSALNARNLHHKDVLAFKLVNVNHAIGNDVVADLLAVVHQLPECFLHLLGISQTILHVEHMVMRLLYTQQNRTTIGVGKRRVSFPEIIRETSLCTLCLNEVVLILA